MRRIISAAVLLAILIPLLFIGGVYFRVLATIIAVLAYREIINLKGTKNYPVSVLIIGLVVLLSLTLSERSEEFLEIGFKYEYLAFAFLAMFIPTLFFYGSKKYTTKDAFELTAFICFIGIVLNLISNMVIFERPHFIMLLVVTIMTDTFAFFVGKNLGKRKFTRISPNKTIEGCIGGIVMGSLIATIYYVTFIGASPFYKVLFLNILLSLACEIGDLFFSTIKREREIKDFSNLIPGHGGVLDRIDSLTFVTLAFILLKGLL